MRKDDKVIRMSVRDGKPVSPKVAYADPKWKCTCGSGKVWWKCCDYDLVYGNSEVK